MPTVTLYTSPGCTDCTAAARAMDRKGVPFAPIDLASESAAELKLVLQKPRR